MNPITTAGTPQRGNTQPPLKSLPHTLATQFMNMLFQCLTLLLSKDIMGQILDLTFCISIHPTVLKAITCILCVAVGMGSHLATGSFHTRTALQLIPSPLTRARAAGLLCCLAESKMALGGGEQGCKQVETVPVMAISIPLGQAQLWMKDGVTGRRKLAEGAGDRRGLHSLPNSSQLSTKTSYITKQLQCRGGWYGLRLAIMVCEPLSLPAVGLCVLLSVSCD